MQITLAARLGEAEEKIRVLHSGAHPAHMDMGHGQDRCAQWLQNQEGTRRGLEGSAGGDSLTSRGSSGSLLSPDRGLEIELKQAHMPPWLGYVLGRGPI